MSSSSMFATVSIFTMQACGSVATLCVCVYVLCPVSHATLCTTLAFTNMRVLARTLAHVRAHTLFPVTVPSCLQSEKEYFNTDTLNLSNKRQ